MSLVAVQVLVVVQTALLLAGIAYLGRKMLSLKREIRSLRKIQAGAVEKTARLTVRQFRSAGFDRRWEKTLRKEFNETIWPQIESLESIGRMLDGKQFLPPTRRAAASPDLLMHVLRIIRADAPRNIVECGSGTSTVAFAMLLKALGQIGHIFSIENDNEYAELVREQLKDRGLEEMVTLIVAPLTEKTYSGLDHPLRWYDIDKSLLPNSIDLLFVDGPEGTFQRFSRYPAGPEFIPMMSANGKIIVDDAARPDEAAMLEMWKALFPALAIRLLRAEKGSAKLFFHRDLGAQDSQANPN